MEQLSGLDAAFIHQESRRSPMHVSAVLIYDVGGSAQYAMSCDELRALVAEKLQRFPVFHRKLYKVPMGMDTPYWVDVPDPDWRLHIRSSPVAGLHSWEDFQRHLSDLHGSQLRLDRPLWDMHLIQGICGLEGLPPNCQALVLRVHHAAIDGMSMAAIINALHQDGEDTPRARSLQVGQPSEWDLWARANIRNMGRQMKFVETVRNLVPGVLRARETRQQFSDLPPSQRNGSRFNKRVQGTRSTGTLLLPKGDVVGIRRTVRHVTLNDIAMSCVGGALRQYLASHGQLPEKSLTCGAPINLREPGEAHSGGNKIATMVVGLATHIADPVERLRIVHRYAVAGKKHISSLGTGTVMDISDSLTPGVLAEGIRAMAWASQVVDMPVPFHTMISNVPGPPRTMKLGKAELVVPLGLGPIRDNMGLFHIVSGSEKYVSIAFNACARLLPDPDYYVLCLRDAFDKLQAAAQDLAAI